MLPVSRRILLKIIIFEHEELHCILSSELHTGQAWNKADCKDRDNDADNAVDKIEKREAKVICNDYEALLRSLQRPVCRKEIHQREIIRETEKKDYLDPYHDNRYDESEGIAI